MLCKQCCSFNKNKNGEHEYRDVNINQTTMWTNKIQYKTLNLNVPESIILIK